MTDAPSLTVLQVVRNLDIGGAQEVVVTLARQLEELGHQPVVCSFRDGPLRADLEQSGVPVELLAPQGHSILALPAWAVETWRIRRALASIVERYSVDVVQTHLLRNLDFVAASLPRRSGRPLVYWTIHNSNFTLRREHLDRHRWLLKPKRWAYRRMYRRWVSRVSGVIAVSDEVRESIVDELGLASHITVIPNGVDVDRYGPTEERARVREELDVPPDAVLMVMVGTFKRQKGHAFLIDAAAEVLPAHPEARLVLVGDGELRGEMEQRVRDAQLDDAVRFLGNRRDVPRILGAADCFVLPSLWEGLPMALLEAMAAQLPCLGTEVSGTSQAMVPGVTGLLVAPGDSDALGAAMSELLGDDGRRRAMGCAATRRVEELFSARKQALDHLARFHADLAP